MKKKQTRALVAVLMGSASDWPVLQETVRTLASFGVGTEVRVLSAHRTPEQAARFARTAARRGLRVIIAAAGSAAHLAGVVAAHTPLPVVGIPLAGSALNGMDALLSTVQMPAGVPVATVAVGKAGAVNAALLAVQILALSAPALQKQWAQYRIQMRQKMKQADATIQKEKENLK